MSSTRPQRTEAELVHNHGHTPAMWTAVTLLLIATAFISVGLFFEWTWLWVGGIVVALVGVIAGWAMSADRGYARADSERAAAQMQRGSDGSS